MHIAIILDGNRRYAKKQGLNSLKGHDFGAQKVVELLSWLRELDIKQVTFYALSTENLKRSKIEVTALMAIFREFLKKSSNDKRIHEHKAKVVFIGRLELLPSDIQKGMNELMEKTKGYSDYQVNFAIAYGAKAEIVDAAKAIARKAINGKLNIDELTEENFGKHLYLDSEVDLLIRPGGEKRISNFLLWQIAYTELIFLEKMWPEITRNDLELCLEEYKKRERRKGL